MKKITLSILIVFILMMLCLPSFGQTKELELYNEWFVEDSTYRSERPFFFIRDSIFFHNFWKYTRLGNTPPYIDFDRFMIFVWAPGYTWNDYSKVSFERILYKDGCLLVLMDFVDNSRRYGAKKRPLKFIILPIVKPCDTFFFRKIKKGWQKYEWKHFYSLWDMSGERKRPFEIVMLDKDKEEQIVLATYTPELEKIEVAKNAEGNGDESDDSKTSSKPSKTTVRPVTIVSHRPIEPVPAKPVVTQPQQPTSQSSSQGQRGAQSQSQSTQTTQKPDTKQKPVISDAPIDFGGGGSSKPSAELEPKPTAAPGMAEDPLFGSEFDITF